MKAFDTLLCPLGDIEIGDIIQFPLVYRDMQEDKSLFLYRKSKMEPCIPAVLLYKRKIIQYRRNNVYIVFFAMEGMIKQYYMEEDCKVEVNSFYSKKTISLPIGLLECGDVIDLQDDIFLFVNVVDAQYTTVNIVLLTPELLKHRAEIIANKELFVHPHHLYFATNGYLLLNKKYLSEYEEHLLPPVSPLEVKYLTILQEFQVISKKIDDNDMHIPCSFPVLFEKECRKRACYSYLEKPFCDRCLRTISALCLFPIPHAIDLYKQKLRDFRY